MIDVSVIIPTYNRLWALPAAVESSRGDRCRTEILVVDDGSTDGTWGWLQTQKDVVAIRQENWGKDWAVNKAFALANGEFIRFLDSDDWLLPGANDAQLSLARSNGADVVVAGYCRLDESTDARETVSWQECDDFIAQQLGECSSSHYSAYLIRRSFIAGIPHRQEFGARDDRMFVIELAIQDPKIATWDAPAFVHCQHRRERLQSPKGSKAITINRQLLAVYQQALLLLEARGQLTVRRKRAAVKQLWPLAHWIAYTDLDHAREIVKWIE
jgi:glycosyltransferase involved in cell wall biosynthesis